MFSHALTTFLSEHWSATRAVLLFFYLIRTQKWGSVQLGSFSNIAAFVFTKAAKKSLFSQIRSIANWKKVN